MVQPLNRVLAEAAARHGWGLVGGVAEAFAAGHGYCGARPDYRSAMGTRGRRAPGLRHGGHRRVVPASGRSDGAPVFSGQGVAWYRTAAQSVVLQGPGAAWDTTGTLHPNELGHLAMSRSLLAVLAGD